MPFTMMRYSELFHKPTSSPTMSSVQDDSPAGEGGRKTTIENLTVLQRLLAADTRQGTVGVFGLPSMVGQRLPTNEWYIADECAVPDLEREAQAVQRTALEAACEALGYTVVEGEEEGDEGSPKKRQRVAVEVKGLSPQQTLNVPGEGVDGPVSDLPAADPLATTKSLLENQAEGPAAGSHAPEGQVLTTQKLAPVSLNLPEVQEQNNLHKANEATELPGSPPPPIGDAPVPPEPAVAIQEKSSEAANTEKEGLPLPAPEPAKIIPAILKAQELSAQGRLNETGEHPADVPQPKTAADHAAVELAATPLATGSAACDAEQPEQGLVTKDVAMKDMAVEGANTPEVQAQGNAVPEATGRKAGTQDADVQMETSMTPEAQESKTFAEGPSKEAEMATPKAPESLAGSKPATAEEADDIPMTQLPQTLALSVPVETIEATEAHDTENLATGPSAEAEIATPQAHEALTGPKPATADEAENILMDQLPEALEPSVPVREKAATEAGEAPACTPQSVPLTADHGEEKATEEGGENTPDAQLTAPAVLPVGQSAAAEEVDKSLPKAAPSAPALKLAVELDELEETAPTRKESAPCTAAHHVDVDEATENLRSALPTMPAFLASVLGTPATPGTPSLPNATPQCPASSTFVQPAVVEKATTGDTTLTSQAAATVGAAQSGPGKEMNSAALVASEAPVNTVAADRMVMAEDVHSADQQLALSATGEHAVATPSTRRLSNPTHLMPGTGAEAEDSLTEKKSTLVSEASPLAPATDLPDDSNAAEKPDEILEDVRPQPNTVSPRGPNPDAGKTNAIPANISPYLLSTLVPVPEKAVEEPSVNTGKSRRLSRKPWVSASVAAAPRGEHERDDKQEDKTT